MIHNTKPRAENDRCKIKKTQKTNNPTQSFYLRSAVDGESDSVIFYELLLWGSKFLANIFR